MFALHQPLLHSTNASFLTCRFHCWTPKGIRCWTKGAHIVGRRTSHWIAKETEFPAITVAQPKPSHAITLKRRAAAKNACVQHRSSRCHKQ